MTANLRKFGALLWKNFLNYRRSPLWTFFSFCSPLVPLALLLIFRERVEPDTTPDPTLFSAFSVDAFPRGFDGQLDVDEVRRMFEREATSRDLSYENYTSNDIPWTELERLVTNFGSSEFFTVAYSPSNPTTDKIMKGVSDALNLRSLERFANEAAMVKFVVDKRAFVVDNADVVSAIPGLESLAGFNADSSAILCGVAFDGSDFNAASGPDIRVSIRFPHSPNGASRRSVFQRTMSWSTERVFPRREINGPRDFSGYGSDNPGYRSQGFLAVQWAITKELTKIFGDADAKSLADRLVFGLKQFAYGPYWNDPFARGSRVQLPFLFFIAFLIVSLHLIRSVAKEKETLLKETLKVMGLSNWLYWTSWAMTHFVYVAVVAGFMTLLLKVSVPVGGSVVKYTEGSVVFVFLLIYSISLISFCYLMSVVFVRANTAAVGGGVIFFLTFAPYFIVLENYDEFTLVQKLGCGFFLNSCLAMGSLVLGNFEGKGVHLRWANLMTPADVDDNLALGSLLIMMLADGLVCWILAWYIEKVRPGDFGVVHPLYFPFTKSYWCGGGKESDPDDGDISGDYYEKPEGRTCEPGIRIRKLEKVFKNSCKAPIRAVKGISLDLYPDEIFVLLGENGAGKSTTIGTLMGLTDPTSGSAWVDGCNVRTNLQGVRKNMGVCPQHNVLFDSLTVKEHLFFYGRLRMIGHQQLEEEVKRFLSELKLEHKTDSLASRLSGGQKRKLSLAIAMMGNPSVLLLDEPTSGMDPKNRRITWELLKKQKRNTTILLTTHFMDEAEVLGNVIGIMNHGFVVCCGSSMYLKNKIGNDYHLILTKESTANDEAITEAIRCHVPEADLERSTLAESSYNLPKARRDVFSTLFRELDEKRERLGVKSYACSAPNIEEIFLKVCREYERRENEAVQGYNNTSFDNSEIRIEVSSRPNSRENETIPKNAGIDLFLQQLQAMLVKKLLHMWRNLVVSLSQILIPNIITLLILLFIKISPPFQDSPKLELNVSSLDESVTPIFFHGAIQREFEKIFKGQLPDVSTHKYVSDVSPENKWTSPLDEFVIATSDKLSRDKLLIGAELISVKEGCEHIFLDMNKSKTVDNFTTFSDNICDMISKELQSVNGTVTGDTEYFIGYFNDQAYHSSAIVTHHISSALASKSGMSLTSFNHPLPRSFSEVLDDTITINARFASSFTFSFLFAMSLLAATFTIFLIKERVSKSKHIQILSGVRCSIFWASTFIVDFFNFLFPCLVTLILFYAFNIEAYLETRALLVLLIMIFYICAQLPFAYLLSLVYEEATTGFVYSAIIGIFTGIALQITVGTLYALEMASEGKIVEEIAMLLSPPYNIGHGMQNVYLNYWNERICDLNVSSTRDLVKSLIPTGILENTPFALFGPSNEDQLLDYVFNNYGDYKIPGYNETLESLFEKPPTEALCFLAKFANISYPCCPDSGCEKSVVGCALHVSDFAMEAPGIGKNLIYFAVQSVLFFGFLVLYEYKVLRRIADAARRIFAKTCRGSRLCRNEVDNEDTIELAEAMEVPEGATPPPVVSEIDDDVVAERRRIQTLIKGSNEEQRSIPTLMIQDLEKRYATWSDTVFAVDGVSLCVEKGQLFGLLGVNGAGKTTCFKMLTGDEAPTDGRIVVDGKLDIVKDLRSVQRRMGYCPQSDALIDQMTGRETLRMFARLRGVRGEDRREAAIETLANDLGLREHLDKLVGQYSGGNKRKLGVAIALVGDPSIVLLDEPTTGMDPSARRRLWDALIRVRNNGERSIVLTSHSMEECEALCSRLAVMVEGRVRKLGSPQELKDKLAVSYYLRAVMGTEGGVEEARRKAELLASKAGGRLLTTEVSGSVLIEIPKGEERWASVFARVEAAAVEVGVQDYDLSQTTLEQVFLKVCESQE